MASDLNLERSVVRLNLTRRIERDAGPIEVLRTRDDGEQEVLFKVEARAGEVVLLEGDQDQLDRWLDEPLMIQLDTFHTPLQIDREGDAPFVFIDGRIDGANWVDALPEFLRGAYLRARRA